MVSTSKTGPVARDGSSHRGHGDSRARCGAPWTEQPQPSLPTSGERRDADADPTTADPADECDDAGDDGFEPL